MCILKKYVYKCMGVHVHRYICMFIFENVFISMFVCLQLNIYVRIKFIAINFPLIAPQYLAVYAPSILSFTALQSCLSCYVSCECSSVQKNNLEKTFKPRHSAIQLEFIFSISFIIFLQFQFKIHAFSPPNSELMSVCMAFVTLVESCSDSRRPCSREGEEEAPRSPAGCRELPLSPLPV